VKATKFALASCYMVLCIFCVTSVRPWSAEEKLAVSKHLGHLVQLRRPPRKDECLTVLHKEPVLSGRDWRAVKNHLASKIRYARIRDKKHV